MVLLKLVHLIFDKGRRSGWFRSSLTEHRLGELYVVETRDGLFIGTIDAISDVTDNKMVRRIPPLLREVTPEDLKRLERNKKKEEDAFSVCQRRIQEHRLPMNLIEAEYHFSEEKITFYFTSQERVDFRALIKDLAGIFKCRIELKQIGDREKSKRMTSELGPCGRVLCCQSFLRSFEPITAHIAREQALPVDPTKIGGMCGKLRCCLRYELYFYKKDKRSKK